MRLASRNAMEVFRNYHPLFVEGMSGYDPRDPEPVAVAVVAALRRHWGHYPPSKPVLLMIQGDPLTERGISAITRRVAKAVGVHRGLIVLDEVMADYHSPNADRDNVLLEIRFSEVMAWLENNASGTLETVETAINALIHEKNRDRAGLAKPPLADYYRLFALLQEASKAAFADLCGEITLAHTSAALVPSSVSSFYTVGVDLGLLDRRDIVAIEED
jgi:hypothetical protein